MANIIWDFNTQQFTDRDDFFAKREQEELSSQQKKKQEDLELYNRGLRAYDFMNKGLAGIKIGQKAASQIADQYRSQANTDTNVTKNLFKGIGTLDIVKQRQQESQRDVTDSGLKMSPSALAGIIGHTQEELTQLSVQQPGLINEIKGAWKYGEGIKMVTEGYQQKREDINAGDDLINEGTKLIETYAPILERGHKIGDTSTTFNKLKEIGKAVTDPKFWTINQVSQAPSNLPLMAESVAGGLGGNLLRGIGAATTVGSGGLATPAGAGLVAAGSALQAGTTYDATIKEANIEAAGVFQEVYNKQLEAGTSKEEAWELANQAAYDNYKANLLIIGGSNAAEQLFMFGKPAKYLKDSADIANIIAKGQKAAKSTGLARGATVTAKETARMLGTGLTEGGQELAQYGAQQWAQGDKIDMNSTEAMENFMGGFGMGIGGHAIGRTAELVRGEKQDKPVFNALTEILADYHGVEVDDNVIQQIKADVINQMPDEIMPQVMDHVNQYIKSGATQTNALDATLSEMSLYPDVQNMINNSVQKLVESKATTTTPAEMQPQQTAEQTQEEAAKTLTALENNTEATTAQATKEQSPAADTNVDEKVNVVYRGKKPYEIINDSSPEFYVGRDATGKTAMLPRDEVSEPTQILRSELQPKKTKGEAEQTPLSETVPVNVPAPQNVPEATTGQIEGNQVKATENEQLAPLSDNQIDTLAEELPKLDQSQPIVKELTEEVNQEQAAREETNVDSNVTDNIESNIEPKTEVPEATPPSNQEEIKTNIETNLDKQVPANTETPEPEQGQKGEQIEEPKEEQPVEASYEQVEKTPESTKTETSAPTSETKSNLEFKKGDTVYDKDGKVLTVTNPGNKNTMRVQDQEGNQRVVKKAEVKTEKPETADKPTSKKSPAKQVTTAEIKPDTAEKSDGQMKTRKIIKGKTSTAKTERGTSIDTQYTVADADDLIASHSTELKENKDYPQELQPRDRSRAASELQITKIANKLEPEFLGESPKASEGAPIVGPDMIVESGNGRVIALKRVYEGNSDNAAKYKKWLEDNADKFGISKEDLAGIKSPVLVRIRQNDIDRASFVKEANEQSTAAMSATEQARSDAEKLTAEMMAVFSPAEDGQILNKDNRFFVREFMSKIIGSSEQGRYATSDGTISQEGVNRIRNAVFAKAYGNSETLEKLAESTDNNVKNITNAMLIAAPKMARLKNGIESGQFYPLDISNEIAAATNKLSQLREQGTDVSDYLNLENQDNLFGEKEISPLTKDILALFDKYKRSSKNIAKILSDYVDGVVAAGSPDQGSLWGESKPPTKAEVLDASLKRMEGNNNEQTSLFGDETVRGQEAGKANEGTGGEKGQNQDTENQQIINNDILRDNSVEYNEDKLLREGEKTNAGRNRLKSALKQLATIEKANSVEGRKRRIGKPSSRTEVARNGEISQLLGVPAKGNSGIRTLALGITKAAAKTGRVDLRGATASTPGELATLAQVFRNPSFETFRIFYLKGNKIVAHEGITSRLPGATSAYLKDKARDIYAMQQRMKRLDADGYYLLHNHPSGNSTLSDQDKNLTNKYIAEVPGCKGHVVIDSNEYSFYNSVGGKIEDFTEKADFSNGQPDSILSPAIDHALLGKNTLETPDIAMLAKNIQMSKDMSVIIYTDTHASIRAIQEVPNGLFRSLDKATDYIRGRSREFGVQNAILITGKADIYVNKGSKMFSDGILQDAIYLRKSGSYESANEDPVLRNASVLNSQGKWMGKALPKRGQRVEEEKPKLKRSEAGAKAPIFYSQLQRVIEQKMPNKAVPNQILAIIKGGQVKAEEIKWSGIEDWLEEQSGKVAKQDVLDYLKANDLQVEDVEGGDRWYIDDTSGERQYFYSQADAQKALDAENEWIDTDAAEVDFDEEDGIITVYENNHDGKPLVIEKEPDSGRWAIAEQNGDNFSYLSDEERYAQYGFEDYDEALEYAEDIADDIREDWRKEISSEPQLDEENLYSGYVLPGGENYKEMFITSPGSGRWNDGHPGYSHVNNPVARLRFNDRTDTDGDKVMFLEEIQPPRKDTGDFEKMPSVFQKYWMEIAARRAIRYAAENGYDRIAWTTGEQQSERYALSKQVGSVQVYRNYKDGKPGGTYQFFVVDPQGHTIESLTRGNATQELIVEMFGKDLGARLIDGADKSRGHRFEVSGDGLKIGGEGLSNLYDTRVPSFLSKYVKKWGSKVEEVRMDIQGKINNGESVVREYEGPVLTADEITKIADRGDTSANVKYVLQDIVKKMADGRSLSEAMADHGTIGAARALGGALVPKKEVLSVQPSVPITPAMKESVLYEGQPKYKKGNKYLDVLSQELGETLNPAPEAMEREDMQATSILANILSGSEIVPFEGPAIQGVAYGGKIFLNKNLRKGVPILFVGKHEIFHELPEESKNQVIEIAKEHAKDVEGMFEQFRKQGYTDEEIWEEFAADAFSEVSDDPAFWDRVRKQSTLIIRQVVDIIDTIISKFRKAVGEDESKLKYIKDLEDFKDKVAGVTARHLQNKPRNIFDLRQADAFAAKLKRDMSDSVDGFSVRKEDPPTKTITAYKLMRIDKDGNLYPLFVERTRKIPTGVWLNAKSGPITTSKTGTQKVKSSLGDLAYRPGWHLGDIPLATHIGVKGPSGNIEYMNPNHVWVECEVAADKNYQSKADANGINPKTGKMNKARADLKEIPVDGYYRYKTNPNMTGEWIITGAMKINRVLSDAEAARIVREAGYEPLPRKPKEPIPKQNNLIKAPQRGASLLAGIGTTPKAKLKRSEPSGPKFTLPDEEVQNRMEAARGLKPETLKDKLKEAFHDMVRKGHREFEWLPRTGKFSELRNALLKLLKQKGVAADRTLKILDNVTKDLNEYEYDIFTYKVIFDDLAHDFDEQMDLPFGLTADNFEENKEAVDAESEKNPKVMQAIEKRRQAWQDVKDEYIAAQKAVGFKVEDRLKKEDYYRHQVLEYANAKGLVGSGKKLKTPTGRGFLKERTGSTFDINTDYLQAEYEVMAQMLYDTEIAGVVKVVKDHYDVVEQLKKQAIKQNDEGMLQYFKKVIEQYEMEDITPEKLYKNMLNKKQARAFSELYAMAAKGELPTGPDGKFEKLVQSMADSYTDNLATDNEFEPELKGQLFSYINWLANQEESEQGQIKARTIFKGMAEKQRKIKNTLGKQYVTWQDLIPEGYSLWQPRDGHMFYMANSIPEGIAEELAMGIAEQVGIDAGMIKKVMVVGRNYPELVVPDEVALTLENLYKNLNEGPIEKWYRGYRRVYGAWKQWQLISPRRYFKYNTRNMTGDIDAVLAGSPGALKKVPQAFKDLKEAFFSKDQVYSSELYEWFRRGGFETLMQAQEINDINRNRQFAHLMESRQAQSLWKKVLKSPATAWNLYWDNVRATTDFREALLRYATYLDYLEQMQKNNGKPKNWGASNRDEIMGLSDIRDRAAKLANELLGAYDEVSVIGAALADNLLPFWRWNEVNFVRYSRLMRNAVQDGKAMAAIGGKITGMVARSPYIAWKVGKFAVKASMLLALLTAWNMMFFRDEEDDLPDDVKERAHIILGRDSDGKVIYFSRLGALQDFLDWFGLDTPYQTVSDFLNGRKTMKEAAIDIAKQDANKVINAVTPFIKNTGEALVGWKLYPDAFKWSRIRDNWQYLFDSFGLGNEYKAIAGKPDRGYSSSLTELFAYKSDPYETAYFANKENVSKFKKKIGKESTGYSETQKSDALYNFKLAMRYKDKEAMRKYLLEYAALGGTLKGMKQSLKSMSPLYGLTTEEKKVYIATLDAEGKTDLVKALQYYQRVLNPDQE